MAEKTSDYLNDATSKPIQNDDYLDFSNFLSGSTWDVSKKIKVSELITFLNSNIPHYYVSDGTLSGNRTVTSPNLTTTWVGGTLITKSDGVNDNGFFLFDDLGVIKGGILWNVSTSSASLDLKNASGSFLTALDGFVSVGGSTTPVGSEAFRVTGGALFDDTTTLKDGAIIHSGGSTDVRFVTDGGSAIMDVKNNKTVNIVAGATFGVGLSASSTVAINAKGIIGGEVLFLTNNASLAAGILSVNNDNLNVGIGVKTPVTVAKLEITSTTQGLRITPMTAVQASAITPVEGLQVFVNTTNATFLITGLHSYENGSWVKL